jgi:membrane-bound inhibitor of C-type lysozyme
MKFKFFLLFLIGNLSSSCSLPKVPTLSNIFSNEVSEKNIRPEDSIEYNCEKKKTFFLFYLNDKKSVWVVLPNREFKLNQIDESQNIYSNTITTLEISPEQTQIKNEEEILYSQCVEKKDGT